MYYVLVVLVALLCSVLLLVLLSSDDLHLHGGITYSVKVRNDNYKISN
jgi:hypothetical protein